MNHRESERRVKPLRDLSARLLQDQLMRLTRANGIIERRLGPGLLAMSANRAYRRLGFVRLGDYLTERLGMSLRRCQSIVRRERALARLPRVAAAFDAGELSISRMRAIADVATPETQQLWIARARRFEANEFATAVRAAGRPAASPACPSGSEPAAHFGSESSGLSGSESAPLSEPDHSGAIAPPAESGTSMIKDAPGVVVAFPAPGRTVALWHWALDLVRRAAGYQEPAWRCVEYLAAEFLSGAPNDDDRPARSGEPAPPGEHDPPAHQDDRPQGETTDDLAGDSTRADRSVPDALIWSESTAAARDALRPLGRAADPDVILTGRSPAGGSGRPPVDPAAADPWDLDDHLRGLVRLRQSLAWRLGRLLAVVASRHLYVELDAGSFSEWCEATLGISARRARYLVSLDRRIGKLPKLADAYRRGLISWCQARHLVRIATQETEGRWLRLARGVTVRGLEQAITHAIVGGVATPPLREGRADRNSNSKSSRHTSAPFLRFDPRSERRKAGREDRRIVFWAPLDVARLWREALAACRRGADRRLDDWQCLNMMIDSLHSTWDAPRDRGWRRRYRIFERDGWRCSVPGCTSRANLNVHHIEYRSRGGSDDDSNLVTLCVGHHQRGIHDGRIQCAGSAPDDLWWELGVRPPGRPLLRCHGDRIVRSGRPPGEPAAASMGNRMLST